LADPFVDARSRTAAKPLPLARTDVSIFAALFGVIDTSAPRVQSRDTRIQTPDAIASGDGAGRLIELGGGLPVASTNHD
jgi:hypothetical protein